MSYQSRVYRQRNPRSQEENAKEPFFGKKPVGEKEKKGKGFFNSGITVNQPGDQYEREADSMASAVVNKNAAKPAIQKLPGGKVQRLATPAEDEQLGTNDARMKRDKDIQEKPIQRQEAGPEKEKPDTVQKKEEPKKEEEMKSVAGVQRKPNQSVHTATPGVAASLDKSKGGGTPLSPRTKKEMNSAFGVDFSKVRIHNDNEAAELNRELNAQAFTHGEDIYFSKSSFDPESATGKFLLAHELTHVVQQTDPAKGKTSAPAKPTIFRKGEEAGGIAEDLGLPCKFGDYELRETKSHGIRVLMGAAASGDMSISDIAKKADAVADRISKENNLIADEAYKVKLCIIAPATTRFTLAYGKPALVLNPPDADVDTVGHEMGHALMHQLLYQAGTKSKNAANTQNFLERITAVFLALRGMTIKLDDGNEVFANNIVDPSVITPGAKEEHPKDPDEFFASAKEAYQKDKKALAAVFAKYGKSNKQIVKLGAELMSLLTLFLDKKSLPDKSVANEEERKAAKSEVENITAPGKLETTLGGMTNYLITMLVMPGKRPKCQK